MARFESNSTVTQSLLDRLIDREPENRADPPISRAQSVRLLKASLRRDMEWLLNSRRIAEPAPEGFAEIGNSSITTACPTFQL